MIVSRERERDIFFENKRWDLEEEEDEDVVVVDVVVEVVVEEEEDLTIWVRRRR